MSKEKRLYDGGWRYAINKKFVFNTDLSRNARFLYIVLLSFLYESNEAFPGRDYLCTILGCSDRSLTKYLQELEKENMINISKGKRSEHQQFAQNIYKVIGYRPNEPYENFSNGKTENLANVPVAMTANSTTKILPLLKNIISIAQGLIKEFNAKDKKQITALSKVINKYKTQLGDAKLKKIIVNRVIDEKQFNSISDLAAYLQACTKKIPTDSITTEPGEWLN